MLFFKFLAKNIKKLTKQVFPSNTQVFERRRDESGGRKRSVGIGVTFKKLCLKKFQKLMEVAGKGRSMKDLGHKVIKIIKD